jgi:ribosomal small subunit protein bTHX
MGKGDKKTRQGKIFMGSFGNTRPQKVTEPKVKVEGVKPKTKKGK